MKTRGKGEVQGIPPTRDDDDAVRDDRAVADPKRPGDAATQRGPRSTPRPPKRIRRKPFVL